MNTDILYHLFIFAGLSFAFAAINIVIGLQKDAEKTYLLFGLIAIFVGIYYLLFPFSRDLESDSLTNKIGLTSFIISFAIFPWFIRSYASLKGKTIPTLLSLGMGITLILFLVNNNGTKILWWNIFAHILLLGIIAYGFTAIYFQYKRGERNSAIILLVALVIFLLLAIDDIIFVHFRQYYFFNLPETILPFDYFFFFFMIIMGIKLSTDIQRKFLLEKEMVLKENRWKNLLEKVELMVVGLNTDGSINYVNPYFTNISKYSIDEIIGKDWFSKFLPESNRDLVFKAFEESIQNKVRTHFHNSIKAKDGTEYFIAWSNVALEDGMGNIISTLSIGSDITEREQAFMEIETLKKRLEDENILLKAELGKLPLEKKIIGKSDGIQYVLHRAHLVAPTDSTVLLEGETGVGKELIANYIQQNSKRVDNPFIAINCAAIPAGLLESEIFGHMKGAFTGADKNKKGLAEMSDGGTLFLDEIGEFPLELQPKLLRFLQEGEFVPLGSESPKKVDVRIIAATNKELLTEIDKGQFRNDLYYRLYVYPITIPALRNRAEDIPELVNVFLKKYSLKHGKTIVKISKLVIIELVKYSWPGNIRELENIIERAVIVSNSDTIKIKDVNLILDRSSHSNRSETKIITLEKVEREHIIKALKLTNWQIHGSTGAADLLGINPSTLRSRIKKLNIIKP